MSCRRLRGSFSRHAATAASPAAARRSSRDPTSGSRQACRRRRRPRTLAGRSASRRARSRTPKCRRACRRACPRACSGRHVGGGAENDAAQCHRGTGNRRRIPTGPRSGPRSLIPIERFRQTKVEHLHRAVVAELDVRRLQIAMDDAAIVRRLERVAICRAIADRFLERDGATRDALRKSPRPSTSSITRRGGDLRRRRSARCWDDSAPRALRLRAAKRASRSRIGRDLVGQHLDRHLALQAFESRAR